MSDVYRIHDAELSPFSVKIRSYFRYKQIPHQWIARNAEAMALVGEELSVELKGETFTQISQNDHAKSLQGHSAKYRAVAGNSGLDAVLAAAGCLEAMQG